MGRGGGREDDSVRLFIPDDESALVDDKNYTHVDSFRVFRAPRRISFFFLLPLRRGCVFRFSLSHVSIQRLNRVASRSEIDTSIPRGT